MIVTLSFLCFSQSLCLTLDYTLPVHLCAHTCICMLHTTCQEIVLAELPSRRWLELGTFHHGGCWFDQPPLVSGCCYLQLVFLLPVLSLYTLLLSSQTVSWQNMPYCYLFSGSDCRRSAEVIPFSGPVRLSGCCGSLFAPVTFLSVLTMLPSCCFLDTPGLLHRLVLQQPFLMAQAFDQMLRSWGVLLDYPVETVA